MAPSPNLSAGGGPIPSESKKSGDGVGDTSEKKDDFYSQVKQIGVLTAIPVVLLVGPVFGFFLGSWIDRKVSIYPWFTITFVLFGFAASGREVARLLRQISKENNQTGKQ